MTWRPARKRVAGIDRRGNTSTQSDIDWSVNIKRTHVDVVAPHRPLLQSIPPQPVGRIAGFHRNSRFGSDPERSSRLNGRLEIPAESRTKNSIANDGPRNRYQTSGYGGASGIKGTGPTESPGVVRCKAHTLNVSQRRIDVHLQLLIARCYRFWQIGN